MFESPPLKSPLYDLNWLVSCALPGKRGDGGIILNGPTARKGVIGDKIIIFCYEFYNEEEAKHHKP